MRKPATLYFVIPCYNEEAVLPVTQPVFLRKLDELIRAGKIAEDSRVLFVDDGSSDGTWQLIRNFAKTDPHCVGITLSRNMGHQNALLAGLTEATERCEVTVSIDCDGQDDIGAVDEMLDRYYEGKDIVYGVRDDRSSDSAFKRGTALAFYKFMRLMGVEIVPNHADYRLMSKQALRALAEFREANLFLRGLVPLVGFSGAKVYYRREPRRAGKSHYPLHKMLHLAVDGITSLSVRPIRMITVFGFFVALFSFAGVLWAMISHFLGKTVAGWASAVCVICLVSGVQLLALGIIGEYIGKIYLETKQRPRFIIAARTEDEADSDAGR